MRGEPIRAVVRSAGAHHQVVVQVLIVAAFALYYFVAGLVARGHEPTESVIDTDRT